MNATLSRLRTHFTNWREWEINPIVIKELRQGVRSWTVTGMLLLFLVVLFIASLGFLITESFDVNANMGLGGTMFSAFMVILAIASIFFIPLYTGIRVASERQENNPDLLYVTTLSPTRIILGKFLCSAYIALLFFSACMPFMAFSNLLRGVDLPTVFFILAYLFLMICGANMIAVFLACIPASRPFKILFALVGCLFALFVVVRFLLYYLFEELRSGVGAMMSDRNFWIATLTVAAMAIAAIGLFFVLSVALISPQSANRALPARIYLTVFWLLGGLLSVGWVTKTGNSIYIMAWASPTFLVMIMALMVTISNSDQLSLRVRRTIPPSGLKRFLAFFFFNGAAGGLLWVGGIILVTFLTAQTVISTFPRAIFSIDEDYRHRFIALAAYAFAYALTALFIQRKFLPSRPPKLTGLLTILLAGGWAIVPYIFLFFVNQLSWKSTEGLQLGNVFNVFFNRDNSQLKYHQYFASAWLVVAVLINMKWFWRQVQNFRPPEKVEKPPATAEVPPMIAS